jgi:hypothetical protein
MPPVRRAESEVVVQKLRTDQHDEIVTMVSAGTKTAADAARLWNVHPAMVSRQYRLKVGRTPPTPISRQRSYQWQQRNSGC